MSVCAGVTTPPGPWAIKDALLDVSPVRDLSHLAAERVDFVHQLRLPGTSHCGVAGLPSDAVEVQVYEKGVAAEACGRQGGLATRVTSPHHDNVVPLLVPSNVPRGSGAGVGADPRSAAALPAEARAKGEGGEGKPQESEREARRGETPGIETGPRPARVRERHLVSVLIPTALVPSSGFGLVFWAPTSAFLTHSRVKIRLWDC